MFFIDAIKISLVFFVFHFIALTASEDWQNYWHEGVKFYSTQQYVEAASQFEIAANMMSIEEQNLFPFVIASKIENNFILQNYPLVLKDAESILDSKNLTDYERLLCALRKISAFLKLGNEEAAIQEYKKYVVGCPLFPIYQHVNNKIIIRNMLDCDCYKTLVKQLMLSRFCNNEKDIHEYGNFWIIDITKTCFTSDENERLINNSLLTPKFARLREVNGYTRMQGRTLEQIEACCNTCDMIAAAATVACGCLVFPEVFAGPWTATACTIACVAFVETMKQDCRTCCKREPNTCWDCFETWKDKFKTNYPNCAQPSN